MNSTMPEKRSNSYELDDVAVTGTDELDARFIDDTDGGLTGNSSQGAPKTQNKFQAKRNITQGMYDVALLMANVAQLKAVLDNQEHKYYTLLVILLGASIALHILSAVLLYIIMIMEKTQENKRRHIEQQNSSNNGAKQQDTGAEKAAPNECANCSPAVCQCWKIHPLDRVATFSVFVVTLLNIFITAFLSDQKLELVVQSPTTRSAIG